VSTFFVVHVVF